MSIPTPEQLKRHAQYYEEEIIDFLVLAARDGKTTIFLEASRVSAEIQVQLAQNGYILGLHEGNLCIGWNYE